ncbi:MAG: [NiFe]-hydrogenase assembly chaperone HybE [Sedimenticola sp.]
MICPEYLTRGLEEVYNRILFTRMQEIPVVNQALEVQTVGFQLWNDRCFGVLVTPWFMNLVLLPNEGDEWGDLQLGTKQLHQLPSGPYEFVLGEEEGVGRYQSCSLFSPMFDFADQETAVATAEAVMAGVMDEENRDSISTREREIAQAWRGDSDSDETPENDVETEPQTLTERMETPISRRDLLRGSFLGDDSR